MRRDVGTVMPPDDRNERQPALFDAPPVYDGKSNMEYQPPGTAEWKGRAWKRIQELEEAVKTACDLIWNEDAVWVVGGGQKLDDWVDTFGPLVGFTTEADERV